MGLRPRDSGDRCPPPHRRGTRTLPSSRQVEVVNKAPASILCPAGLERPRSLWSLLSRVKVPSGEDLPRPLSPVLSLCRSRIRVSDNPLTSPNGVLCCLTQWEGGELSRREPEASCRPVPPIGDFRGGRASGQRAGCLRWKESLAATHRYGVCWPWLLGDSEGADGRGWAEPLCAPSLTKDNQCTFVKTLVTVTVTVTVPTAAGRGHRVSGM